MRSEGLRVRSEQHAHVCRGDDLARGRFRLLGSVTDMMGMFSNWDRCKFEAGISKWQTGKVRRMSGTFAFAQRFNA